MQKNLIHPKHYVLIFYEYHQQLNLTQFDFTQLDPILPKPVPTRAKYFQTEIKTDRSFTKPDPISQKPQSIWTEPDPYLPISSPFKLQIRPHFTINLSRLNPKWPENDPFVDPNRWPLPFSYQFFSIVIGWSENWMICIWPMR